MNPEQYYNKDEDYTDEQIEEIEFGEECGLVFQNELEEGRPVFLGGRCYEKAWELYDNGELVR